MTILKSIATKAVAGLTLLALVAFFANGAALFSTAHAADLTQAGIVPYTDSRPTTESDYRISFFATSGVAATETITVDWDPDDDSVFDLSSVVVADVDLAFGSEGSEVDATLVDGLSPASGEWGFDVTGETLTLKAASDESITAGDHVVIEIGALAGGTNGITNGAAGTHEAAITSGSSDSLNVKFVIVAGVAVTAEVEPTLTFTVSGVSSGTTAANADDDCGGGSTTGVTTTATTVPFGTLTAGTSVCAQQNFAVTTNASRGYQAFTFTEGTTQFANSAGDTINVFDDNVNPASPEAWGSPAGTLGDADTYGHWGYSSSDADDEGSSTCSSLADYWGTGNTGTATKFYDGVLNSEAAGTQIMGCHDGPADGSTDDKGAYSVVYKVEITALQEAGNYANTLVHTILALF